MLCAYYVCKDIWVKHIRCFFEGKRVDN
jgi:hypothetical protein